MRAYLLPQTINPLKIDERFLKRGDLIFINIKIENSFNFTETAEAQSQGTYSRPKDHKITRNRPRDDLPKKITHEWLNLCEAD
jgi:flagellar basal body L-ring protein FlgH